MSKGIKRSAAKALRFDAYKSALMLPPPLPLPTASLPSLITSSASSADGDTATAAPRHKVAFNVIRSHCHILRTIAVVKAGLCAFDDKRFVLDDGVSTLAHGHWRT